MDIVAAVTVDAISPDLAEVVCHVAVLAGRKRMQAEQRKARQVVIETRGLAPGGIGVAFFAATALRASVNVDARVAIDAECRRSAVADRHDVTQLAVDVGVRAVERERALARVIELRLLPGSSVVAGATVGAIPSSVIIIARVTARARRVELRRLRIAAVAVLAAQCCVVASQRKAGLLGVVERLALPARRLMALAARRPQAAPMRIVEAVAVRAVGGGGVETLLWVTERAIRFGVASRERELGRVVIESHLHPVVSGMAIAARPAERALVSIVLAMTVDACARRVAVRFSGRMALAAGRRGVRALERQVRAAMIEPFWDERRDARIRPLVLGVARSALRRRLRRKVPVEAQRSLDVGGDCLVTHETQLALGASIEALVARPALACFALVGANQRAGRDQPLYIDRMRQARSR